MNFKKDTEDFLYMAYVSPLRNFFDWWRGDMRASWIIHFVEFFILAKWSGIHTSWVFAFILFVELWEAVDWSWPNIWNWFKRWDTWVDMLVGAVAVITAKGLWPVIWNALK